MLKRPQPKLCRLMSRNICCVLDSLLPHPVDFVSEAAICGFSGFGFLRIWNVSKCLVELLASWFPFYHLSDNSFETFTSKIFRWKYYLRILHPYVLFSLEFLLYLNFVILKYGGLINKAAFIQQGTYWKISKMFNFPRAPFIAAAKRSQFEQFARRFSSKSYSTGLHALP